MKRGGLLLTSSAVCEISLDSHLPGTEALVVDRDEDACKCILGTEYPSLDCLAPFAVWLTDRQVERCEDPKTFEASVSFCTCVQTLDEQFDAAAGDPSAPSIKSEGYWRCDALEDRLDLPPLQELAPAFAE